MAKISTQRFLDLLDQSHLLPPEQVTKLRKRVEEANRAVDPIRLARRLVDREMLTGWQARQLLAGRNAFYLGRYKLLDRLGKGGMGVVFRAEHTVMDRIVALKVMSPELLRRESAVTRFNREVKAAAALNHANIIVAFDADCVGNTHFLVMECVEGHDLNTWLRKKGPFPVSAACECAMQTAEGLQHAYHKEMVHRDIKPVNLLLTWDDHERRPVVKILDMGLARFASESREDGSLTRAGQMIGTPDYIAPEAAQNFKHADIRADIFSLGCALFKLLTGRLPFVGDNVMEKLMARASAEAPSVRSVRSDVPEELGAIVAKMLAREPDDRYATPAEVVEALRPFAASTLGQEELDFLRELGDEDSALAIEPDADTSLEIFFRDFSVSPLRDEGSAAEDSLVEDDEPPRADAGGELELAPLDDEPPSGAQESPSPPVAKVATPVKATPVKVESSGQAPAAKRAKPARREAAEVTPVTAAVASPAGDEAGEVSDADDAGLLDDLMSGDPLAAAGAGDPLDSGKRSWWGRSSDGKRVRRQWDSALILFGGGGLAVLVVVSVVLVWALGRTTGDQAFQLAEEDFKNQSYTQAIAKFSSYIEQYPSHPNVSVAKVHRGLARMRQAVEGSNDWPRTLEICQDVIGEISTESEFEQAADELAALLPRVAEGLANMARDDKQAQRIEQARTAMELVDKYVLPSRRNQQQLDSIEATLALAQREIDRGQALEDALAEIAAAVADSRAAEAYDIRAQLLQTYPDLEDDAQLVEAVIAVTAAQQAAVRVEDASRDGLIEPADTAVLNTIVMSATAGSGYAAASGQVCCALVDGVAFGLDAETGRVLWRRFVGLDVVDPPQIVRTSSGPAALLYDAGRGELMLIDAQSGATSWRQPLGDRAAAAPLVVGRRAVVATAAGAVETIDLDSGASLRSSIVPQPLETAPAADRSGRLLYQPANHTNLYALDAETGKCAAAFYLGHTAGSIATSPIVVSRYVVLAENHAHDRSRLRVLLTDEQGIGLSDAQSVPLEGHVRVPPVVDGSLLHVTTDRGAWYTFAIAAPGESAPLSVAVEVGAREGDPLLRYPLVRSGKLWLADAQLAHYQIQSARQRLVAEDVVHQGDIFVQPLVGIGDAVFHVRRLAGTGRVVAALESGDGTQTLWQTELAAPVAMAPLVEGNRLVAMAGAGAVHVVAQADLGQSGGDALLVSAPTATLTPPGSVHAQTPVAIDETLIVGVDDTSGRAVILEGLNSAPNARWFTLPARSGGALAALGGLVVPSQLGQVFVVDVTTGTELAAPFQPPLAPGSSLRWQIASPSTSNQLLASDTQNAIYTLEVESQPTPHLVARYTAELASPLASPIASVDNTLWAATESDKLAAWRLPDLEEVGTIELPADLVWGPQSVGSRVFVATADDQLLCLTGESQPLWSAPLAHGPLAGRPGAVPDGILIASPGGVLSRLDVNTGEELASIDVAQPLEGGPVAWGDRVVLTTFDGALLVVARP